ncbi:tRNA (adenosine(37)-N6)-threonylcarbamoyltransferase complex dimerization subunit type 1 TsaB [Paenibacillus sp. IB182496]|uniref:tRNA (Adenosine(37)-N6)-threonylcarbamoyltransferase complex dimerization subunit type 1 TsaB n=2 Tax=Paenibacillus sabuli TaxID=2772509 RepID=A0A927BUN2_9BACL|nr:tRNA (adenosine(37)-N6)-threonylcarbamoyltransferase complex dimerization subunit type 1 TsaB [Paenibacillus sabuli]
MHEREQEQTGARSGAVLGFDTSTAALAAALIGSSGVLGEVQSVAEKNHSVHLIPMLQRLLREAAVRPEALTGIAVGCGPGSYTGVRIAVTAAKTLAWVWDKPVAAVSSLEALAYGAWRRAEADPAEAAGGARWFVPIMDARRGQVYSAAFAASAAGGWTRLADDGIRLMDGWTDELLRRAAAAAEPPQAIVFAGDPGPHAAAIDALAAGSHDDAAGALRVALDSAHMAGRWVAELGRRRLARGEADEVHGLTPNYTQLAEAEAKLRAAAQGREG